MPSVFRTTGLLSLIIWVAFFIIGLINDRPFICIISGLFFVVGFYRRIKVIKQKEPADILWEEFVKENPEMKDYPYQFWQFASGENTHIYDKLESRKIKSQSFLLDYFEANNKPLPSLGQLNILCCDNIVIGVCKTVDIIRVPFNQVDIELTITEGFSSLDEWRKAKKKIFSILCDRMGIDFSENMEILFEKFEIVFTMKK